MVQQNALELTIRMD